MASIMANMPRLRTNNKNVANFGNKMKSLVTTEGFTKFEPHPFYFFSNSVFKCKNPLLYSSL